MAIVYRSNAPEYFRYLATIYSRDEIKANPQLCHLLEDPYLKDDMELALTFNEAENGGYNEKREFIQFLLANGPELDAGTIMYYRNIILNDPEYDFIANAEFNDISVIDTAREEIYGKTTSKDNCFRNPCNYLGPFSVSMGKVGDSSNFMTVTNLFSTLTYRSLKQKQQKADGQTISEEEKKALEELSAEEVFCDAASTLWNKLIPNYQANWSALTQCVSQQYKDFAEHLSDKKVKPEDIPGDPGAIERARALTPLVQFHLHQKLGDCSRLFDYARSLNLYDPVQNTQSAVTQQGNKTVAGVPAPGNITTDENTVGTKENTNPKIKKKADTGSTANNETAEKIEYVSNNETTVNVRNYNGSFTSKTIDTPQVEIESAIL